MSDPDRQYRDLADLNPDAFIIQVEGTVVYCNQSARRMFRDGETARLIGMDAIQLVDPDVRDFVLNRRNTVLSTGEPAPYIETRHLRLDGTSFPSQMVVGQVTWGGRAGTMNIIHDITERKKTESALKESERRYRDLFGHAVVGIYRTMPDGRHLEVNPALARMRGCDSPAEFMAHFLDARHPIYVDPAAREKMSRLMREQGYVIGFESEAYRRDGTRFWMSETGRAVSDEAGQLIAYEGFILDITERKRAEEALRKSEALFRALVDNLPIEIAMRDTKGRYLLVNPAWEKAIGRRHEDVIGGTVHNVFAKEEADFYMAQDRAMLAAGRVLDQEVEITREGGAQILHIIKFPIRDARGNIASIGGITTDITERKQTEQALRESRDQIRLIADNLPVAITYFDSERRYRFVNRTMEKWFGRPAEEILGHTIGEVLGQEAHEAVAPHVNAALKGEEQHYEQVIAFPDGKLRTLILTYVPDLDESETARGCFALGQDITERKRAEEALRESESLFRAFVDNIPVMVVIRDTEGHFLFVNSAWEKNEDQTNEQMIGKTVHEVYLKEEADLYQIQDRAVLETGQVVDQVVEVPAMPDRKVIPDPIALHTIKFPIRNSHGDITKIAAIGIDITEHKQAEAALRESEERFRTLVEHAPEAITMLDVDTGLYLDANPMAEALHGLPRDELIGKLGPADLSPEFQPDGRPSSEVATGYLSRALDGEFPKFEWMHLASDGQETLCEISLARLPDPHRNLVRASITDITERKQAEEALRESEARYRAIVEDQIELICRYLPDQTFTFVNDAYCRYFDQARENLIGRKFAPLIPDEDIEIVLQRLAALDPECPVITHEHRVIAPSGEIRWHLWTDRAIFDTDGRVIEYQSVGRDITDQKSLDAQLRQAQKMEALGQLAGGTAHEINNLLQPIFTFAKLTRDEVEDPEHRQNLDRVLECGRRAKEIVADILIFARKVPSKPEAIEVRELMTATVRFVRNFIPSTIEFRSEISSDTGQALISRTEFTQVIINLAQNAVDAIDSAGTVSIAAKIVDLGGYRTIQRHLSDGRYCRVSVKDTGSGMAAETLKRIFEPFFTTKLAGKGTGLGLSIVYGIVTGWGGSVSADSVVGEGSVFDVYIPLIQEFTIASRGLRHDAHTDR